MLSVITLLLIMLHSFCFRFERKRGKRVIRKESSVVWWYRVENVKVKLATLVEGDPKAPFSIATTLRYREGRYSTLPLSYNAEC